MGLMLSCSDSADPNNLTTAQLGEPNFHTNTLIVATDWGPKTFDEFLKAFERDQKVRVKLIALSELAALNAAERPAVDLYLLGSLQAVNRLNTDDFQFVQPKASIRLQAFASSAETPWVMLGYWPLLSASNAVFPVDLDQMTQQSVDPVCAPESQVALVTKVLEGSGFFADPEQGLGAESEAGVALEQSETQGALLRATGMTTEPRTNQAVPIEDSAPRSLTATSLNLTQALNSATCSSLLFFDNNQFALNVDERLQAAPVQPILIDGPIAMVPKTAINPLKALWLIEWLLDDAQQQRLSDQYQTHTVISSRRAAPVKDEDQVTQVTPTEESVEWTGLTAQAPL